MISILRKIDYLLLFKTDLTEKGLKVTILENVLFDSGKADVKLESLSIAKEMSNLLVSASPREITVSGHTDNVPIANAQFASNWELSTQRAVNFMQVLLQNKELQPGKFSAVGYGEYRSIAPNDTQEGKAKNRRVEVFILPLTKYAIKRRAHAILFYFASNDFKLSWRILSFSASDF